MSWAATPPDVTLEPLPAVPEFTNPLRPGVAPSADCAGEILMEARVALQCLRCLRASSGGPGGPAPARCGPVGPTAAPEFHCPLGPLGWPSANLGGEVMTKTGLGVGPPGPCPPEGGARPHRPRTATKLASEKYCALITRVNVKEHNYTSALALTASLGQH